eukprot:Blabericola_migrator_1__10334@NODE_5818_length_665_cov_4_142140_g3829_i0_p1_GENE_NODE_5818_length_665_cov_4_142140_g3829_i0NODE_5818_length_665_cov_4_142140_g3829_i0_p1_ORF_typecomplete_len104_score3_31rve/PF00665_26/3_5e09rve/PF00665_26/5_7e03rve_3/PF13683_6/5_5e02rve_3/PF13683_6/0_0034_NODE_5818_length_665_cov_4_142140_g3829_i092403
MPTQLKSQTHSDNASYFTCAYFARFMANFNTTVVHSAPWHPQGHAHIERFNRQLEQILYNYNQTIVPHLHPSSWMTRHQGLRWMMNLRYSHTQMGASLFDGFR